MLATLSKTGGNSVTEVQNNLGAGIPLLFGNQSLLDSFISEDHDVCGCEMINCTPTRTILKLRRCAMFVVISASEKYPHVGIKDTLEPFRIF